MNSWLRTRRVWLLLAGAFVCVCGEAVLGDGYVSAPVAVGFEGRVLWSTFLPLAWVAVACDVLTSKAQGVEARPALRLKLLDAALFALVCAVGASVFAAGSGDAHSPSGAAGSVLVLTGLASGLTLRRGPGAGALGASALMVITTMYGIRAPGGRYVRVLQPDGDPIWALALGVALCAAVLTWILLDPGNNHHSEIEPVV